MVLRLEELLPGYPGLFPSPELPHINLSVETAHPG